MTEKMDWEQEFANLGMKMRHENYAKLKALVNTEIKKAEKAARLDELDRSPSTYANAEAVKVYYRKRRAKLTKQLKEGK